MSHLYVVATPIGNLEDLSARAARILSEVRLVVAEDTREARKLLAHSGARRPLSSYHAHSEKVVLDRILKELALGDVAYVSDAGTPAVSDPGPDLVRAATDAGHEVVAVPGPSAVTAALSVSGLPADSFLFLGFLPRKSQKRRQLLQRAASAAPESTIVLFEAPHRLQESLQDLHAALGDRRLAVCRELTKMFEETFRGTVTEAIAHFTAPRGEFVIVVEGAGEVAEASDAAINTVLERLRAEGLQGRHLVETAATETGVSRSRIYRLALASRTGAN